MRVVRTRFGRVWFPIYYGRCKMRTLQLQPEEQNNQHHSVLLLLLLPLLAAAAAADDDDDDGDDDDDDDDDGDDDLDVEIRAVHYHHFFLLPEFHTLLR